MSSRQRATLRELLAKQPPVAPPSAEAASLKTPFFDQVADRAATSELGSFEALLTEISGAIDPANISQFPKPECLSPNDVYQLENLGREQQAHLSTCPWCKNMVAAAQSSEEDFKSVLAKCREMSRAVKRDRDLAASY